MAAYPRKVPAKLTATAAVRKVVRMFVLAR
jgi:hypothetical protein